MFIGRKRELCEMQRRYDRSGYECIVLYGRRRVGKTALIREFCRDKQTIFFTGLETTARENLENFSQSVYDAQGGEGKAPVYADFSALLAAITAMARKEKLVFVIDEFPYLAKSYLQAVADGRTKLSQIAATVGIEVSACAGYLKNLIALGIVERETPLGEKQSRKSIYLLQDSMFRFWYRFVPQHYSMIQNGMGEAVCQRIEKGLSDFMGQVFERICKEWIWRENGKGALPMLFDEAGRWWGNDPREKRQAEIDLLAWNVEHEMLFCECKWRNEPLDSDVLELLVKRSELFFAKERQYILFTKRQFSDRCRRRAESMGNVRLVSFSEMLSMQEDGIS